MSITPEQLKRMRRAVLKVLPDTAVIYSPDRSSDGAGGWSETWVAAGTVACRLDPMLTRSQKSRQETEAVDRETLILDYILTVPHDAPLAPDRQVEIGGLRFEVRALGETHSWRISRRAYVTRVV